MILLLALLLGALPCRAEERDEFEGAPGLIPPGGMVLYYDTSGPFAFAASTPKDIPKDAVMVGEVRSRSCQHGLAIPTSLSMRSSSLSAYKGDGSYEKALRVMKEKNPELRGIFDVKVDQHVRSILGIYRRLCTEISAKGYR